jgi:hypothetical protein
MASMQEVTGSAEKTLRWRGYRGWGTWVGVCAQPREQPWWVHSQKCAQGPAGRMGRRVVATTFEMPRKPRRKNNALGSSLHLWHQTSINAWWAHRFLHGSNDNLRTLRDFLERDEFEF